ncbi:MAG: hypothetical protein V3V08_17555 [Nannocystaceae bacterium]
MTLSRHGYRLVRTRLAAGAGYAWKRDTLHLPISLELGIEPWAIYDPAGQRVDLRPQTTSRAPTLFDVTLRIDPAYEIRVSGPILRAIRVGPVVMLGSGHAWGDGSDTLVLHAVQPSGVTREISRLGGMELEIGVGATLWFARDK